MSDSLVALARAAGLDPEYTSWRGEPARSSDASLFAMLKMLGPSCGYELGTPEDADKAVADCERAAWRERVPAVVVGWGGVIDVAIRVPADFDEQWEVDVTTEGGARHRAGGRLSELRADQHAWPNGVVHCVRHARVVVGEDGYHAVEWRVGKASGESMAVCAPMRAFGGPGDGARRWGVFAPMYGLASAASGQAGDLASMAELFDALAARGGSYVATLPILAQFLDEPCAFSPYSPASRLWWNELYLDLSALASDVQRPPGSASLRPGSLARPDAPPIVNGTLIDYRACYAQRRRQLDSLVVPLLAARGPEIDAWARTAGAYDYAAFRALGEHARTGWRSWTGAQPDFISTREGAIAAGCDAARVDAHVVAQWAMQRQLDGLRGGKVQLYLDLPVGVNTDAYEVWRWREQFLLDASAGAPPDPLFLGGQDWGLPPLSPTASRREHHRYFIACIRHHVRNAGMLRVDHVMGLFRLYCVPHGRPATDGVYLRYPHDELLAILALESARAKCALVGEDLGTVPDGVRPAMEQHGMFRIHVGQWYLPSKLGGKIGPSPAECVAGLNTHDTPTFAGWWTGADIADKRDLDLIDSAQETKELAERAVAREAMLELSANVPGLAGGVEGAMVAATADLAAGPAEIVLVALDDLTLDPVPHNVPGTTSQRPNWQRRIAQWRDVLDPLRAPSAAAAAIAAVVKARPARP